jgi:hypothetical protein
MYVRSSSSGFGQVVPAGVQTAAQVAATGIATTTSIMGALGSTLTVAGLAIPVVGAAIAALVGIGLAIANAFKGCGQTCIAASNIANQVGALLVQNVNAYTSSPVRYASMQTAALNTYDTAWAAMQKACSDPSLGAAGQRCISDRQAGACTWKASPGGWQADGSYKMWGAAGSGDACWNWFIGMRDPIANDPNVQPDPVVGASSTGSGFSLPTFSLPSSISSIPTPLLWAGGLAAAAVLLGGLD